MGRRAEVMPSRNIRSISILNLSIHNLRRMRSNRTTDNSRNKAMIRRMLLLSR